MKTWQNEIPFTHSSFLTENIFTESALFFDIETTGFSPSHTQVYLIGCAARKGDSLCITQFFSENDVDEKTILLSFLALLETCTAVITFNGLGFDIPYLKGRLAYYHLPDPFESHASVDIFKTIFKYKHLLKLDSLKQKSIEQFLGIKRDDTYSGGDLINVYFDYRKAPNERSLHLLKLHNYEDVAGMVDLLPILSYVQLFEGNFLINSYEKNVFVEYEGSKASELLLRLQISFPLPKRISFGYQDIYLTGNQNQAVLKIKIYQGELKYFYSNYRDYYYLPEEDRAIHKSVAFYVDKDYRTKAKAATCYSKKTGCFLPQFKELFDPYFKLEYHDKVSYFEMTEDFTQSESAKKEYALHLLQYLLNVKRKKA